MSEPIIEYRNEFNTMDFVSKYAERVSRVIDEHQLASVEHQLAEYDYVKVVRCRDCKHANEVTWPASSKVPPDYLDCGGPLVETWDYYNDEPKDNPVPPNGFCFYGERRDA